MPRRRRPELRDILPDPVYNSTLAEKFVNSMMWDGKKNTAQRIFYEAMDTIRERTGDDPLKHFKKAIENAKPLLVWKGDTLMAVARYGKGTVFAVTDPWLYNEYTDGRKLPPEYDNFAAGRELVRWLLRRPASQSAAAQ